MSVHRPFGIIIEVSGWLRFASERTTVPGGAKIEGDLKKYQADLGGICAELDLQVEELRYLDIVSIMSNWINKNA